MLREEIGAVQRTKSATLLRQEVRGAPQAALRIACLYLQEAPAAVGLEGDVLKMLRNHCLNITVAGYERQAVGQCGFCLVPKPSKGVASPVAFGHRAGYDITECPRGSAGASAAGERGAREADCKKSVARRRGTRACWASGTGLDSIFGRPHGGERWQWPSRSPRARNERVTEDRARCEDMVRGAARVSGHCSRTRFPISFISRPSRM